MNEDNLRKQEESIAKQEQMKKCNKPRHGKTNVLVFDQVRHKPGCTATEDD